MTATTTTTITMRIITTPAVAIAAIVPPLKAKEPPGIYAEVTERDKDKATNMQYLYVSL